MSIAERSVSLNGHENVDNVFPIHFEDITREDLRSRHFRTQILILSDIHAGSGWGQMPRAAEIVEHVASEVVIFAGDTFHVDNPGRHLNTEEWDAIERIRVACARPRQALMIPGNHDPSPANLVVSALGVKIIPAPYLWKENGAKVAVIHGHEYSPEAVPTGWKLTAAEISHFFARTEFLRKFKDNWGGKAFGMRRKVLAGLERSQVEEAHVVAYGHVHEIGVVSSNGRRLVNFGCCLRDRVNFTTLDSSGLVVYEVR